MAAAWAWFLLLVVFVFADATPHRRSPNVDCELGSIAIQRLLTRPEEWFPSLHLGNVTYEYVYEGITGTTPDQLPPDILCSFTGLTNLDDFYWRLYQLGYLEGAFQFAYKYATGSLIYGNQYVTASLESPEPWMNTTELRVYGKLLSELEASGILSFDPDGFLWFYHLINPTASQVELPEFYPTEEDFSTEDISVQARRITNDLRKVWNMVVRSMSHVPDPGQYMRDKMAHFTGINLEHGAAAHFTVLSIVSEMLESVDAEDPSNFLFEFLEFRDVLRSLFRAAYPETVELITFYEDPSFDYDNDPMEEAMDLLQIIIQAVRNMGLLDLEVN